MKRRIVIAGGSGLIGQACQKQLKANGYEVLVLTRSHPRGRSDMVQWDPARREISDNVLDGAFGVINLTGASLAGHRWTTQFKQTLISSRVEPAIFLSELIDRADIKPTVYIGASGIGIYGSTGPGLVSEETDADTRSFLGRLAVDWEAAHARMPDEVRLVILRTGVVLTTQGGYLQKMLLPAKFGLYPVFGQGDQYLSWIHMTDHVRLIEQCIDQESIRGIYNAVSGSAVTYRTFARAHRTIRGGLGIVLGAPIPIVKFILGEMADMLLDSCNADASKLMSEGFKPQFENISAALRDLIRGT